MTRYIGIDAPRLNTDVSGREIHVLGISVRVEFDSDRVRNPFVTQSFPARADQWRRIVLNHEGETFARASWDLKCERSRESTFDKEFLWEPRAGGWRFACSS